MGANDNSAVHTGAGPSDDFSIIGVTTVVATFLAPETLAKLDRRISAAQELDEKNADSTQRVNAN